MLLAGIGMTFSHPHLHADELPGYTDTPIIPGQPWHVHDAHRPRPRVVTPAASFSLNAGAPSDAVVLFDGKDLSQWQGENGGPAGWKIKDGYMEVTPAAGSIRTKQEFEDFQLHLEFAAPEVVKGNSQGRGNSGIFLLGQYEAQVLDSYENPTYADGQLGGMYGQFPPLANPSKKPGEWQSYDIIFEAPRWNAAGQLIKKATVTIIVNGVVLQNHREYLGPTKHRELTSYHETRSSRGPIGLQDHGDLVRYRNIWIRPLGEIDQP
ncbi:MAG TPA: DUF1080 domain-containing protein [Verrucomicrobiota bacterium]|nr:DUF1080 domain-containing protein [Verrucomicrobiota bacterium]HNT13721.1 DUF1080 domain-containing protein [Verrucomicrobiota bacterium]